MPRVIEEPTPTSHSQKKKKEISRRPELDVIIVALTWVVLLCHACSIYSPFAYYYLVFPELDGGPIKEDAYTIISAGYIVQVFKSFMRALCVPTFFYLSGNGDFFFKCQTLYIIIQIKRKIDSILFQLLQASTPTTPCSEETRPSSEKREFTAFLYQPCFMT